MRYGICNLSIVALRSETSDSSEMVTQILYGELFKVLEVRKHWSRIRLDFDDCEGWVQNKQYVEVDEQVYQNLQSEEYALSDDLVEFVQDSDHRLITIPMGASLKALDHFNHTFEGQIAELKKDKTKIIDTAFNYLNAPFLWGGKTPFGIDSAGFTQMVYKLNGFKLFRTSEAQSSQGIPLSFIEESEAGDLAFFDDNEGKIIHVGIIMNDNYIIHVDGKVRIDRIDHSGIYNINQNTHTHKLRVIKKVI